MNLINQICEIKVAKGFKATVSTDGNIIVEKKEEKYIPKDGDFFYCEIGGGQVYSILKDIIDGQVKVYCTLLIQYNDFYTSGNLASVLSCNNMRLLTEEKKEILLTRIKQEGYVWDVETKTLDPIYVPKEGDIVHYITNNFEGIAIFKEICGDIFYRHCAVYKNEDDKTYNRNIFVVGHVHHFSKFKEIRLATEEERNILLTSINAANKVWNSDLKILYTIPKVGDLCIFWNLLSENAVIDILERVTSSSFLASKQGFYDKCVPYNEELYKKMIEYKP